MTSLSNPTPAGRYAAITPSDDTDFAGGECTGIYVGGTGDVVVVDADGNAVTFAGVPAGTVLYLRAVRVNNTNTDATSLVALYAE